jgi:tRNA(Ile)-lysidine synthase
VTISPTFHTHPLVQRVREFIERKNLILKGEKVLAAVSGGPDSVFLLHVLMCLRKELDIELFATHINYRLREKDSEEDKNFVTSLCLDNNIPLSLRSLNDRERGWVKRSSPQEKARQLRYNFFIELCKKLSLHKVATGHTQDDQAETILLNIIRGSGLNGLGGIPPLRDGIFCRPLLKVKRSEIIDFLNDRDLSFRTDATNLEDLYRRNRIRHQLIPLIEKEYNPNIVERLVEMADQIWEAREFIDSTGKTILQELIVERDNNKIVLDLKEFNKYNTSFLKILLRLLIYSFQGSIVDISSHHIDQLVRFITKQDSSGIFQLPHGLIVGCSVGYLSLMRAQAKGLSVDHFSDTALTVPGTTRLKHFGIEVTTEFLSERGDEEDIHSTAVFDFDVIEAPLVVRSWKRGDRIDKPTKGKSKKLSDYFLDARIPKWQRATIPLVTDSKGVLWIIGHALSEKYLPDQRSKQLLRINIKQLHG